MKRVVLGLAIGIGVFIATYLAVFLVGGLVMASGASANELVDPDFSQREVATLNPISLIAGGLLGLFASGLYWFGWNRNPRA